ncbi:STN domain-containing protein [Pseudomonas aeruginosa]|nr:STN domain-containing protein [Pseudomonas aeruginosa]
MAAGAAPPCASPPPKRRRNSGLGADPPPTGAKDVLNRFARACEAAASPSRPPAQTGGYSSQGLRGSFTVQQGLARLLADTPPKRKTRATAASSCARRRQRTAMC